jgi:mono/diheme cytochrome c family protein
MRSAMVKGGLGLFATGFAAMVLTAAVHGQGSAKVDAAEVYKVKCQVCHQADGNSQIMPNMSFADGEWKHGSSVKEVSATIINGVPGTAMMPFKGQLTDAEIAALARFVRQFDKKLKPAK